MDLQHLILLLYQKQCKEKENLNTKRPLRIWHLQVRLVLLCFHLTIIQVLLEIQVERLHLYRKAFLLINLSQNITTTIVITLTMVGIVKIIITTITTIIRMIKVILVGLDLMEGVITSYLKERIKVFKVDRTSKVKRVPVK